MQPTLVTQVGDGAGTTLPVDPDHPQSIQSHLLPDHHAHLLMRFLNTGREATTIVDVSFDIAAAPVGPVKASLPFTDGSELSWCSKTGFRSPQQPPLVDCAAALPYTLEPGTIYTVSIGLDGYLPGMSTYAPNGFNVTVDAGGVQDSQVSTKVPLSVTP